VIGLINDVGTAWAAYFGPVVLQNTMFVAVILIVLYLLRNASARLRYTMGLIGIVKLLLPPFVPIRPSESTSAVLVPLSQLVPGAAPVAGISGPGPQAAVERLEWAGVLFAVWLGVTAIYIVGTVLSTVRLRLALREASDITETMAPQYVGDTLIRLCESRRIAMPLTVGLRPTKIFVPTVWRQWSDDCRGMILRHEVAHIRRRDGVAQALQILAQSLYFFHPLVWYLNRRIHEYREMACDDAAAGRATDTRLRYSEHLANIAESAVLSPLTGDSVSALLRRKHELLKRIQYQLKEGKMNSLSRFRTALMIAGLALLVVPLSGYIGTSAPGDHAGDAQEGTTKDDGMRHVTVGIVSSEKIKVDGTSTSMSGLKEHILANLEIDPENAVLRVVCDDSTPMGALFDAQRVLAELDLLKVSYMSDNYEAFPLVLPSRQLEEKMKEIPAQHIAKLVIDRSGGVLLEGRKIELVELDKVVKERISDDPMLIVSLHADREATYGQYVSALHQLKKGGAQRIFVNNSPS